MGSYSLPASQRRQTRSQTMLYYIYIVSSRVSRFADSTPRWHTTQRTRQRRSNTFLCQLSRALPRWRLIFIADAVATRAAILHKPHRVRHHRHRHRHRLLVAQTIDNDLFSTVAARSADKFMQKPHEYLQRNEREKHRVFFLCLVLLLAVRI